MLNAPMSWCKFGATLNVSEIQKALCFGRVLFLSLGEQLSLPLRASEVIFDSEVHIVSEVSPNGEVTGKLNFTFAIAKTSLPPATSLLR